jgi:hypothetical protein
MAFHLSPLTYVFNIKSVLTAGISILSKFTTVLKEYIIALIHKPGT